ncbi:MAG: hypothetical protein ACK4VI_07905 [Alphaproteobacteria bacterium]
MKTYISELIHNCNTVRRQVEDEFSNFTAQFIIHNDGQRAQTLVEKRNSIISKPYGRKIYDILSASDVSHQNHTEFAGLIINDTPFYNIFGGRHFTAIYFINADTFSESTNSRHFAYHMAWHALSLYFVHTNKNKSASELTGKMVYPDPSPLSISKNNLMADIFGSIMMEATGHKGFIEALAKKRSQESLVPILGHVAAHYPYPIAHEACKLVYDDMAGTISTNTKLIQFGMDITDEVGLTFDHDESIKQWWLFCKPAQEMAWLNHKPEVILTNSIYNSGETFVHAFAYQISDLLNIEPDKSCFGDHAIFNAFSSTSQSRQSHELNCEEVLGRLLNFYTLKNNNDIFHKEILRQNTALKEGHVSGWCALSLENTMKILDELILTNPKRAILAARETFYETQGLIPWPVLRKLTSAILEKKCLGEEITYAEMLKTVEQRADTEVLRAYLLKLDNSDNLNVPISIEPRAQKRDEVYA